MLNMISVTGKGYMVTTVTCNHLAVLKAAVPYESNLYTLRVQPIYFAGTTHILCGYNLYTLRVQTVRIVANRKGGERRMN